MKKLFWMLSWEPQGAPRQPEGVARQRTREQVGDDDDHVGDHDHVGDDDHVDDDDHDHYGDDDHDHHEQTRPLTTTELK